MTLHHFHLTANWPGGRNQIGTIKADRLQTKISIPPEMNGPGIGTNPDEMLLGAAATCYIITLAAMLERSQIHPEKLELHSEGIVEVTNGVFTYKEIIHRPYVHLDENLSDDQINKVHLLVQKAEKNCMISRALSGNVTLTLQANVHRSSDN